MTLTPGSRFGVYAIITPIGAGGMGEVYRARDTRLERDVALKVLPSEFASDSDRLARFEREAKVLASLNHPGIAAIHGIEESGGVSGDRRDGLAMTRGSHFMARGLTVWDEVLWVVPVGGGDHRPIARSASMRGMSWLPDGTGLVYSSSKGSTLPYPPTFNLRVAAADGSFDTQITSSDVSFVEPDAHESGRLVVCRIRSDSDIWKVPVGESPAENTRKAEPVTRQTGQVQTPSVSPDGSELVYLSDNGGHANLWVTRTDGSRSRQITFERDRAVTISVPRWSKSSREIAYIVYRDHPQLWLVRPDGRGARKLVEVGFWPSWSEDGQWLYFTPTENAEEFCLEKISVAGGSPVPVRGDRNATAPASRGDTLYYAALVAPQSGSWDWEIRRASPEHGPSQLLAHVAGIRLAVSPIYMHLALSRDGHSLALALSDGAWSNLWLLSTADGSWRQVTDFSDQPTTIARQVSWSPDGQYLYAAISKTNADIVMLDGLV